MGADVINKEDGAGLSDVRLPVVETLKKDLAVSILKCLNADVSGTIQTHGPSNLFGLTDLQKLSKVSRQKVFPSICRHDILQLDAGD